MAQSNPLNSATEQFFQKTSHGFVDQMTFLRLRSIHIENVHLHEVNQSLNKRVSLLSGENAYLLQVIADLEKKNREQRNELFRLGKSPFLQEGPFATPSSAAASEPSPFLQAGREQTLSNEPSPFLPEKPFDCDFLQSQMSPYGQQPPPTQQSSVVQNVPPFLPKHPFPPSYPVQCNGFCPHETCQAQPQQTQCPATQGQAQQQTQCQSDLQQ
ncbi:MAG TPA: hypothetical protein ENO18_06325 [Caldithrix sp.]|nr:hypothetical protein [Caldithrix sp.]